ncbi:hypothetical protein [Streptomyces sp. NPDC050704]|uniref:hypothetical protein n=1 Tax=Streptomyces sp. NPDC050704 TaxID=3157219 RepID=UPI003449BF22
MLEAVVAVVGALVGVVGLVTSYSGHRHSVREAARVALLERGVREREREAERQAERQAEVVQASLVQVVMSSRPSPLAEQWLSWVLQATNRSDQPLREVALSYGGRPLPASVANGLLHAGQSLSADLPPSDVPHNPVLGVVEFTDAAGVRWRRSAMGVLERRQAGGAWDVQPPNVAPAASPFPQPGASYRQVPRSRQVPQGSGAPPRRRKRLPRAVSVVMVVVGAVLVAWATWSLTR